MSEYITEASGIELHRSSSDHTGQLKPVRDLVTNNLLARIAVRINGRTRFVSTECVLVVRAQGNYVSLQCESSVYLLRESITVMEKKLGPYGFVRIHRSVLVNRLWVEEIQPHLTGDYGLRLRGGKEFKVTRSYKKNLKSLAELWLSNDSFLD